MMIEDVRGFHGAIAGVVNQVLDNKRPTSVVLAKLSCVSPLQFDVVDSSIELKGNILIVPKYRVFTADEVGHEFVFITSQDGQRFYYLYEAAAPGANGIPYQWHGTIEGAHLTGTCPDGEVVVTGGSLGLVTHSKGVR